MKAGVVIGLCLVSMLCAADTPNTSKIEFVYPEFYPCYEKNKASFVYFGTLRAVAISEKYAIAYSKEKPTVPFVKHDPLSHLYLFESPTPLHLVKLKSTENLKLGEWLASIGDKSLYTGTLSHLGNQQGIFEFGINAPEVNTIITGLCCEMYGLGIGGKHFISSEMINKFVDTKNNPPIDSSGTTASNQQPKIQKTSSDKQKAVSTKEADMSDYLNSQGLFLTQDLIVTGAQEGTWAGKSGLKVGDKLLQINGEKVNTRVQASSYLLSLKQKEVPLLFERNKFQFFVTFVR